MHRYRFLLVVRVVGSSLLLMSMLIGACGQPVSMQPVALERVSGVTPSSAPVAQPADEPTPAAPAAPASPPPEATTTTTSAPAPTPRTAYDTGFSPFAATAGITLVHPAATVERVGFHESSHDGAQPLQVLPTAVAPMLMKSRERGTAAATASDIVVHPAGEIRSPVTGTVKRAGTYVLYCKHSDEFLVIEPDDRPGFEVKLLHVTGLRVRRGERVTAGETVVAGRATPLPFESQVDEGTARPAWPHVHLEVVDPTVKDRPSPGGGCS